MESSIYWLLLMFFFAICQGSNNGNRLIKLSKKRFLEETLLKNLVLIKEQHMMELSKSFARRKILKFTMSKTKATSAVRAIHLIKQLIYRYKENHGEKFFQNLPHFVSTMIFRVNRFIRK